MTEDSRHLEGAFICRHCNVFARHDVSLLLLNKSRVGEITLKRKSEGTGKYETVKNRTAYGYMADCLATVCEHCERCTIWLGDSVIYPATSDAPHAHRSTPEHIIPDYDEAASIVTLSPRGACALLRLALQKLLQHLGGNTGSIDGDIRAMALAGMSPTLVRALDSVRITGNEAVHPGKLDIRDQPDLAQSMFALFNVIVEQMIAVPNEIAAVYARLPESKTQDAERRDAAALRRKPQEQPTG